MSNYASPKGRGMLKRGYNRFILKDQIFCTLNMNFVIIGFRPRCIAFTKQINFNMTGFNNINERNKKIWRNLIYFAKIFINNKQKNKLYKK